MKKIILYILVFIASLYCGIYLYEKPEREGVFEKYIYENPQKVTLDYKEKAPMPEEGYININTATIYELTALPDIGPKMAERIVSFRESLGVFEVKEDILRVDGIGEKTFEKIKDKIILE